MRKTMGVLALAGSVLLLSTLAWGQEGIRELLSPAFGRHQRPAALFEHDAHNEKAKLQDCVACHHGGGQGRIDPSASSEGTPCSECHAVSPAGTGTSLMRAFHKQCVGCHTAQKKGPLACGECHVRK